MGIIPFVFHDVCHKYTFDILPHLSVYMNVFSNMELYVFSVLARGWRAVEGCSMQEGVYYPTCLQFLLCGAKQEQINFHGASSL